MYNSEIITSWNPPFGPCSLCKQLYHVTGLISCFRENDFIMKTLCEQVKWRTPSALSMNPSGQVDCMYSFKKNTHNNNKKHVLFFYLSFWRYWKSYRGYFENTPVYSITTQVYSLAQSISSESRVSLIQWYPKVKVCEVARLHMTQWSNWGVQGSTSQTVESQGCTTHTTAAAVSRDQ